MTTPDVKSLSRVLTAHGYAIKKTSLTPRRIQALRKDLTVAPQTSPKFMKGANQAFTVYTESPTRFYVPRHWGSDTYGNPEATLVPEGLEIPKEHLAFTGAPYDYQEAIINKFLKADANGLICVPCGKGKTFMALAIAARLKRRFLVIVDKEFLMNQWRGEMAAVWPSLRVGILQGNKCETDPEDFDVTICMIQTLVQREFPEGMFKTFGFAIFDECHHLGAAHFSRALLKVQTKHMLGLSATPKRDDGLTKVFEWFLGKPVYWEKTREPDAQVIVRYEQLTYTEPSYTETPVNYKGELIMARLLTRILEHQPRNEKIAEIVRELCEDEHRRVLVLSERISHLEAIENLLKPSGLTMSYYVGGMKEEEREAGAQTARVLLASYAMASEAMNIKTLNSVILASPRKKVEQSTGRILRIKPEQRQVAPVIVDIVDVHGVYQGQWKKRHAYYKKCAYKVLLNTHTPTENEQLEESDTEPSGCLILDD